MSKASVAQEPSMDEILASIRRIIETGEDRGGAGGFRPGAVTARDASLDAIRKEAEDAEAVDDSNLSYFQRPGGETISTAVPSYGSATPTASFPDRASDGRAAFGVDEDHLTVQLETELAASWGEFESHHHLDAAMNAYPASAPVEESVPTETADDLQTAAAANHIQTNSREDATMSETARHQVPTDRGTFEPANTDRRGLDDQDTFGTYAATAGVDPLLSASSGQMVAASFDELAQAIRSGELKSLEAMAQDMLKPMLAEWLDDNLPRMVERLVREEIERLSRGGRR